MDSLRSNVDSTNQYLCASEDDVYTGKMRLIQQPELCDIFQQCSISHAIQYSSGNIHLVFNHLLPDQSYGVFLTVDRPFNEMEKGSYPDKVTYKYYTKRIPNTRFYLNAESNW